LKVEISLSHLIGLEKSSTITEIISSLNSAGTDTDLKGSSPSSFFLKNDNFNSVNESRKNYSQRTLPQEDSASKINLQNRTSAEFSFDYIVSRWEGFIKEISEEKALTVAPFIKSSRPLRLDKNRLDLSLKNELSEQQRQMFSSYENYLLKKTEQYFGRRLFFQFGREEPSAVNSAVSNTPELAEKTKASPDAHINAIISELNGEEIT
jgi:hypothetical protein